MWREESDGVVSPVVAEAFLLEEGVVDELVDGHEFDGGDAEFFEVVDDCWVCEAGVGAADVRWHVLVKVGHAAYVGFVDDGVVV